MTELDAANITNGLLERLARMDNAAAEDERRDGILYCGKCGEPKQAMVEWIPDVNGNTCQRLVPVACRCVREAEAKAAAEDRKQQFRHNLRQMHDTYGLHGPGMERYSFDLDDSPDSPISRTCREYVNQWKDMRKDNIGILFYGSVGTGKSYYAGCIVNALLDRLVPAAMASFPSLITILQGTSERQNVIRHLQDYRMLALDDLGAERDSAYALEQVWNIVDARAVSKLPMIVTTNLDLEDMQRETNMQQKRIYDRVIECCPIQLRMDGESRRKQISDARREKARELLRAAAGGR